MSEISFHAVNARAPSRSLLLLRNASVVDRFVAVLLLPAVLMCLAVLLPIVLVLQGRPFLFASERMATPERAFMLLKIRTMSASQNPRCRVLGGDITSLVTPIGRVLRRFRLDELPQIFNVLKGDIRFIGPRPPLRRYVEAYPALYRKVLMSKPGITGLATVMLHRREERILSKCKSAQDSDRAYRLYCIAPKARLDLLYEQRRSIGHDLIILFWTFARLRKIRQRS